MLLRFTKMHGLGNDFVVIDAVSQQFNMTAERARRLGDRRFGIGCDQILLVEPPPSPGIDFSYRIFNQDGTEVEQCGNGARCFARFVRDRRLTGKSVIRVHTRGGDITLRVQPDNQVVVNMGAPRLDPQDIPAAFPSRQLLYPVEVAGQSIELSSVSMGNPHGVIIVDDVESAPVETLGPALEEHPVFPQRANIGFMEIVSRSEINLRVFERGAGETLACGTGACAAVVAGRIQDLLDSEVNVNLPGGSLQIQWSGEGEDVMMTGPATTVYQGRIKI
ncbi:MAG: diaminopimelate epimerase [bacterium]